LTVFSPIEGAGYIWNAALRAGLTIRNYGVFSDELPAASKPDILEPEYTNPPTKVVIEPDPILKNYADFSSTTTTTHTRTITGSRKQKIRRRPIRTQFLTTAA